jgi:hypothetical protein
MYLNNLSLMSLILRQALQAPAHKARKNKWRELRESWAWKPWLLRWHCLLYERWRWSCHRHSCESAKGWSHWWLFGRSFQPLIQQSWTHPLRCFTLECQPFATKRVCRNPCGHGWVYMGAKLGQRQVGNFQSQEQTRSSGLYGCHQDNTVSHQTKRQKCEKNKGESAALSACGWYGPLNTSPTRICLENRLWYSTGKETVCLHHALVTLEKKHMKTTG